MDVGAVGNKVGKDVGVDGNEVGKGVGLDVGMEVGLVVGIDVGLGVGHLNVYASPISNVKMHWYWNGLIFKYELHVSKY